MKKNICERDIAILMADRYTRAEAIRSLELGTMVYEDPAEMAQDYDVDLADIRSGLVEDLKVVIYGSHAFGIAVVH